MGIDTIPTDPAMLAAEIADLLAETPLTTDRGRLFHLLNASLANAGGGAVKMAEADTTGIVRRQSSISNSGFGLWSEDLEAIVDVAAHISPQEQNAGIIYPFDSEGIAHAYIDGSNVRMDYYDREGYKSGDSETRANSLNLQGFAAGRQNRDDDDETPFVGWTYESASGNATVYSFGTEGFVQSSADASGTVNIGQFGNAEDVVVRVDSYADDNLVVLIGRDEESDPWVLHFQGSNYRGAQQLTGSDLTRRAADIACVQTTNSSTALVAIRTDDEEVIVAPTATTNAIGTQTTHELSLPNEYTARLFFLPVDTNTYAVGTQQDAAWFESSDDEGIVGVVFHEFNAAGTRTGGKTLRESTRPNQLLNAGIFVRSPYVFHFEGQTWETVIGYPDFLSGVVYLFNYTDDAFIGVMTLPPRATQYLRTGQYVIRQWCFDSEATFTIESVNGYGSRIPVFFWAIDESPDRIRVPNLGHTAGTVVNTTEIALNAIGIANGNDYANAFPDQDTTQVVTLSGGGAAFAATNGQHIFIDPSDADGSEYLIVRRYSAIEQVGAMSYPNMIFNGISNDAASLSLLGAVAPNGDVAAHGIVSAVHMIKVSGQWKITQLL